MSFRFINSTILYIIYHGKIISIIYYWIIIFFPDTSYQLVGFYESESVLYAVVEQAFIKSDQDTDLENVKNFLDENGFKNTRNNDYFNPDLGIILEDLHDENVLTHEGNLYFIDTVFYITPSFYQ